MFDVDVEGPENDDPPLLDPLPAGALDKLLIPPPIDAFDDASIVARSEAAAAAAEEDASGEVGGTREAFDEDEVPAGADVLTLPVADEDFKFPAVAFVGVVDADDVEFADAPAATVGNKGSALLVFTLSAGN